MFSHIVLGTNDLVASRRFYDAVMPALWVCLSRCWRQLRRVRLPGNMGSGQNCLWLGLPAEGEAATCGNETNVALLAETREQVNRFYAPALAAGALDEGAPGLRDVHPHFYAAYVRDPDGHKLVVVCHKAEG